MPGPWPQHQARTIFLRVPRSDWSAVKRGFKTEFRASGRAATQVWRVQCPTPVVAYSRPRVGSPDSSLMVLESTWREALGGISESSLSREGFTSLAHFRRYWMARHGGQLFRPLLEVQVYHVRPWSPEDAEPMGLALLDRLYGEHLAGPVPAAD